MELKIAICFFGITRSLSHTIGSIERNILSPAQEKGEVRVFAHFFRQAAINNPRSGEVGVLKQHEHELLSPDWLVLEEPDACLEKHGFEALKRYGDAWDDEFRSLRNLVHQLHSLSQAYEAASKWWPDVVIFARPDLAFHDTLRADIDAALAHRGSSVIHIPDWQHTDTGLNDRFAVATFAASKTYGTRVTLMHEFCEKFGRPLHSESLVKYCLQKENVVVKYSKTRASRVRKGGLVVTESFRGRHYLTLKRVFFWVAKLFGISTVKPLKSALKRSLSRRGAR